MVNNQCIHGKVKGSDSLTYSALMHGSFTQSKIVHSLTNITRITMSLRLVTLKTKLLRLNLKYKQELQKHMKC